MGISIYALKDDSAVRAIEPVRIPLKDAARIAGLLGIDEQIELEIHPDRMLESLARAKSLGLSDAIADDMIALAEAARDANHYVEWYNDFHDGKHVQVLAISLDQMGEPSTHWTAGTTQLVFEAIGVKFDLVGRIDADELLTKCSAARTSNFDLQRRIGYLSEIASWAKERGLTVGWS